MTKSNLLLVLAGLAFLPCVAQSDPKISSLKAPAAPASYMLGIQPSAISKPKSWQALETAIYSNFLDSTNNLLIPDNFALEFSPLWAATKPSVKLEDFLKPTMQQTLLQNLSLSLSSTKSFLVNDSVKSNALGFGARTMLWQGTKNEKELVMLKYKKLMKGMTLSTKIFAISTDDALKNLKDPDEYIQQFIQLLTVRKSNVFNSIRADFFEEKDKTNIDSVMSALKLFLTSKAEGKNLKEFESSIDDYLDEFFEVDVTSVDIEKYTADRKGFKLEFATAMALNYPTNNTSVAYGSKFSMWITPSFQPMDEKFKWLEFLGVFRYNYYNADFYKRFDSQKEYFSSSLDYGAKILVKWKKISLDVEAVWRSSNVILSQTKDVNGNTYTLSKQKNDNQCIATLSYKIDDSITLTYHFGKQFQPVINYKGNLISVINLNFGFGAPTRKNIQM